MDCSLLGQRTIGFDIVATIVIIARGTRMPFQGENGEGSLAAWKSLSLHALKLAKAHWPMLDERQWWGYILNQYWCADYWVSINFFVLAVQQHEALVSCTITQIVPYACTRLTHYATGSESCSGKYGDVKLERFFSTESTFGEHCANLQLCSLQSRNSLSSRQKVCSEKCFRRQRQRVRFACYRIRLFSALRRSNGSWTLDFLLIWARKTMAPLLLLLLAVKFSADRKFIACRWEVPLGCADRYDRSITICAHQRGASL